MKLMILLTPMYMQPFSEVEVEDEAEEGEEEEVVVDIGEEIRVRTDSLEEKYLQPKEVVTSL